MTRLWRSCHAQHRNPHLDENRSYARRLGSDLILLLRDQLQSGAKPGRIKACCTPWRDDWWLALFWV